MKKPSSKYPKIKVMLPPKKLISGARSKTSPNDITGYGSQYREKALMPFLNESINDLRVVWEMTRLLRHLARIEGPISTAIFNMVQVADCGYTIAAYDTNTGEYDEAGTETCTAIINQMECSYDVNGFSVTPGFAQVRQTMLREVIITNGIGSELVLNKAYLPERIQIVGMETLQWVKDKDGQYKPIQFINGDPEPVSLDIPTFFVSRAAGDPTDLLPRSIMEAAIKLLVYFEEILEDIRKTMKQTGYARNVVTLNIDKIMAAAPRDVKADAVKFAAFCEATRAGIEKVLENLDPEDSLVMFDTSSFDIKSPNFGKNIDYSPLLNSVSGMYATSMKTPPTVLGMRMDSGSQALGNVETLIFLKAAAAMQKPVETQLSRILTMAARLNGADVYVKFEFDAVNIRPDIETEAFKTMRQTRILEQLSVGLISDQKASLILKTGKRPAGSKPLSGTFFTVDKGVPGEGNDTTDENGVTTPSDQTPGGTSKQPKSGDNPAGRTLKPDKGAPRKAGGRSQ